MSTEGQSVVPGTESHFQQPAAEKPKRVRGPSKKKRAELAAEFERGRLQGQDEGRPPMLGVLGIFIIGAIVGAVVAWLVK